MILDLGRKIHFDSSARLSEIGDDCPAVYCRRGGRLQFVPKNRWEKARQSVARHNRKAGI